MQRKTMTAQVSSCLLSSRSVQAAIMSALAGVPPAKLCNPCSRHCRSWSCTLVLHCQLASVLNAKTKAAEMAAMICPDPPVNHVLEYIRDKKIGALPKD